MRLPEKWNWPAKDLSGNPTYRALTLSDLGAAVRKAQRGVASSV